MFYKTDTEIDILAETKSRDSVADEADASIAACCDGDDTNLALFEAGFELAKKAGDKQVYGTLYEDPYDLDDTGTWCFFIGDKDETIGRLRQLPDKD